MNPLLRDGLHALALVWLCVVAALLLSGCGGGDWEEEPPVQPPECGRKCAL